MKKIRNLNFLRKFSKQFGKLNYREKSMVDYEDRYETAWKSPIFQHPLSYADQSVSLKRREFTNLKNGKIILLSFPKCGNVWMSGLLSDYFEISGIDPVRQINERGVGVSHLPFCNRITQRADFVLGVSLVRDPRDVIASFFHNTRTKTFRKNRKEVRTSNVDAFYYDWFLSRVATSLDFNRHAETYARFGVPVVKYENLRRRPELIFTDLLMAWGFPVDKSKVKLVVENNSIENLRKGGKKLRVDVPSTHFRTGEIGGYEKTLSSRVTQDIEIRFARMIGRWGYNFTTSAGKQAYIRTASQGLDLFEDQHPAVEMIDSWKEKNFA